MKLCLVIFIIILIYILYILQNDESFYINYGTYYKPQSQPVNISREQALQQAQVLLKAQAAQQAAQKEQKAQQAAQAQALLKAQALLNAQAAQALLNAQALAAQKAPTTPAQAKAQAPAPAKAQTSAIWGNKPCNNFCPNMCLQSGNKYDQTGKNLDKNCYKYCKGNTSNRFPC